MTITQKFLENAKRLNVNIDSVIFEQHGKAQEVVLNDIKLHQLRSCGKLLIAMAYGIAINLKMPCKVAGGGFRFQQTFIQRLKGL